MTERPATLYDVAVEAGVSLATASRVLNGSARVVADDYRQRVLAAAARLDYQTNRAAQAFARGTAEVVALMLADIVDPYFSSIARGVTRAAAARGLLVMIAETGRDPDREIELVRRLAGFRPRLLVLTGSRSLSGDDGPLTGALAAVRRGGARIVQVGHDRFEAPAIRSDNRGGARALAERLGAAHPSTAILAGPEQLVTAVERVAGFGEGLRTAGAPDPVALLHGEFTRDGGYAAAQRLLERGIDDVELVFAVTDVMAIGALTALREAGVAVPERVQVAGFDDIPSARDAVPPLSTARIDLESAGESAVALGLDGGEDPDAVLPTVVLRGSTRG